MVTVTLGHMYHVLPDGSYWTSSNLDYSFWLRYLDVFEEVSVVTRAKRVTTLSSGWSRVDGPGVFIAPITPYHGPWQYLRCKHRVYREVGDALTRDGALILRTPSQLATIANRIATRSERPFAVEVVGDPYEVFAPGALRHPLRPLLRVHAPAQMRKECGNACAIAYVSERELKERYPARQSAFTTTYSSIDLKPAAFVKRPRLVHGSKGDYHCIFVGSLQHTYKALDVLLDALAYCRSIGTKLQLTVVGDGARRTLLERQAQSLGLTDHVEFCGRVSPGSEIRALLDRSDLFILPSRTEGLPRAMIEAMARGLPCIGTAVGGIPELVASEDLVPANDADALANKIIEVVSDMDRMARMSGRNLNKAHDYRADVLQQRRNALYFYVMEATAAWRASAVV